MADDTFNNDNQESLMGDDEFTEVEATIIEDDEAGEQEESLEAKINHGIGTLDINVGQGLRDRLRARDAHVVPRSTRCRSSWPARFLTCAMVSSPSTAASSTQ